MWVAALLASMLALARLFAADHADGTLEQLVLAPHPLGALVAAKVFAHWLVSGFPLLLVAPPPAAVLPPVAWPPAFVAPPVADLPPAELPPPTADLPPAACPPVAVTGLVPPVTEPPPMPAPPTPATMDSGAGTLPSNCLRARTARRRRGCGCPHPMPLALKLIADAWWKAMQQNCIAQ